MGAGKRSTYIRLDVDVNVQPFVNYYFSLLLQADNNS